MLIVKLLPENKRESVRKAMLKPVSLILNVAFFVSGVTFELEEKNAGGKSAPILLMVPHTSFFDLYPALVIFDEVPSFVVRKEALDFPFLGNLLRLMGAIYVQRESPDARKEAINMMLDAIKQKGRTIAICPEGTYSNRSKLLRFKAGAFATGLPVQPCLLKFEFSQYDSASFTCEGPGYWKLVWLCLCQAYIRIKCVKLPVYEPSEEETVDPQLYAEKVRKWVSQISGIPTSPYIFDDVFFLGLAKQYSLPRSPLCIKFTKLAYRCTPECVTRCDVKLAKRAGIKAEDTNMLFRGSESERKKQATLQTLAAITEQLSGPDHESWLNVTGDIHDASQRILTACSSLYTNGSNGSSGNSFSPNINEKSAVMCEIRECISGRSLDQHTLVTLAAILSTPGEDPWERIHRCYKFLLRRASQIRPTSELSKSQWDGLLWVLLGLERSQIGLTEGPVHFTWQTLRYELPILFPQAVAENAPFLL